MSGSCRRLGPSLVVASIWQSIDKKLRLWNIVPMIKGGGHTFPIWGQISTPPWEPTSRNTSNLAFSRYETMLTPILVWMCPPAPWVFMANLEQGCNTLKVDTTGASKMPTVFCERLYLEQQSKKNRKWGKQALHQLRLVGNGHWLFTLSLCPTLKPTASMWNGSACRPVPAQPWGLLCKCWRGGRQGFLLPQPLQPQKPQSPRVH